MTVKATVSGQLLQKNVKNTSVLTHQRRKLFLMHKVKLTDIIHSVRGSLIWLKKVFQVVLEDATNRVLRVYRGRSENNNLPMLKFKVLYIENQVNVSQVDMEKEIVKEVAGMISLNFNFFFIIKADVILVFCSFLSID